MNWQADNEWERNWWGDCANSYDEETKQLVYANRMGLQWTPDEKRYHRIDLQCRSIIDVGGGPASLLLKCFNGRRAVVDPCGYPAWVAERYTCAGIAYRRCKAEDLGDCQYDEAWCYNCLQHVEDPAKVIANMRRIGRIIRLVEPLGTSIFPGHPHSFSREWLDGHLGGEGKVEHVNERTVNGILYYGIFKGDQYV